MRALALFVAVLVVLGVLIAAAGAGYYWWVIQTTPAYRLQLDGTSWRVASIDNVQVPAAVAPTLSFMVDNITVQGPCGTATSTFAMDTDGAALLIGPQERAGPNCDPEATRWHDAFATALETTDGWDVVSDDEIRLIGAQTMRLERVQSP